MKRFTLFLIVALAAAMLPAAPPQGQQPPVQAPVLAIDLGLPGLDGLTGLVVELVWHLLEAPPVSLNPDGSTTANDGGGWVPNPPLPPPPPHP